MLKRLVLCLLLTTNLYSVEQSEDDNLSTAVMTAVIVTAGTVVLAIYGHDSTELDQLILKVGSGDVIKALEVLGVWMVLTQVAQGLIAAPTMLKKRYKDSFLTEEQKSILRVEEKAIIEKGVYLKARIKLRNYLINSKYESEKNDINCPIACEEMAREFIVCGGKGEMIEMISDFNEYTK